MRQVTAKPRKTRLTRNPDRVTANQIDPVFYYEIQQCASLDDEIEDDSRFDLNESMGTYETIHGFSVGSGKYD